jgi:hypothetical protein
MGRIHTTRTRVDIDKDRDGADLLDGGSSRHGRVGHGDHFIPHIHADSLQRQRKGVGPVPNSNAMSHSKEGRPLPFKSLDLVTEDIPPARQDAINSPSHGLLTESHLRARICERNGFTLHEPPASSA